MRQSVCASFSDITPEMYSAAGGKGATLARLYQEGYPVPDGFVVFPSAFTDARLPEEAWECIHENLLRLQNMAGPRNPVAIRSSASDEDSAGASFAGEFESVLNVDGDEPIREAIQKVYRSRNSQRVEAYTQAKGIDSDRTVSVIVQKMVVSDISGVLFTADPVSGNLSCMTGNVIEGLGDRLVSGEANGDAFRIRRPDGEYEGPTALERFYPALYRLALRLEKELGLPQDIEWTIAADTLYLLQSRPITTLHRPNPATGDRNDSFTGDFLWSNVNFGEAIPDVMTPFTASAMETGPLAQFLKFRSQPAYGVINGRPYLNISVFASVFRALGKSKEELTAFMEGMALNLPKETNIPLIPSTKADLLTLVPKMILMGLKEKQIMLGIPRLLRDQREWCNTTRQELDAAKTKRELVSLWERKIKGRIQRIWFALGASAKYYSTYATALRRRLIALVGPDDADALISGMSDESHLLASLGPVVGLSMVERGKMSGEAYLEQYGHRSPDELELSSPRPCEQPDWLEERLACYRRNLQDVEELLSSQRKKFESAWDRFGKEYPGKGKRTRRTIGEVGRRARLREEVRSEYVRAFGIWRVWALRAGALTGLNEDIFFLTLDEVVDLLKEKDDPRPFVPARKISYARNKRLPPFPTTIRGRFDPLEWVSNPARAGDHFDGESQTPFTATAIIEGVAGSAGRIKGTARCLSSPEQGDQLLPGEILVTSQTNIGWTFVFPKAAAIITDIGAPLSHAVIVARELGIPAVVGCGDATARLKTGDRVKVDGSRGIVEILK